MFPLQQWTRERGIILRCTHLAYLVFMLNLNIVDKIVFAKIVISADPFLVLKKPDRFPDQLYYMLLFVFVLSILFTIGSSYSLYNGTDQARGQHAVRDSAVCCLQRHLN
jgi:hypothetical protein